MSLNKCLLDYKDALEGFDTSGLDTLVSYYRSKGLGKREAELNAVQDRIEQVQGQRDAMIANATQTLEQASLPKSLSTRTPGGPQAVEDFRATPLVVGLQAMKGEGIDFPEETQKRVDKTFQKNIEVVTAYNNYRPIKSADTPEKQAERFVQHMVDNLLWLHDNTDEADRQRSTMWYEGARAITDRLSERYGHSPEAVAGVMAAMSPQKDWYMNVSLGERIVDIYTDHQNTEWSPQMTRTANRIFGGAKFKKPLAFIKGKKLSEMNLTAERAMWIRIYDEAHNSQEHRIVSPEGDFKEVMLTQKGAKTAIQWSSVPTIAKAVSALENPTEDNISDQIGDQHKVRNFYNNIINPLLDNTSVTIDTHAVAAALLVPLAGEDLEVVQNFGGAGSSSTKFTGTKGTYGLYAEAYRRAALARGLQPRQMQSITWEAARGLFTARYKAARKVGTGNFKMDGGKRKEIQVSENQLEVRAIWKKYRDGKITQKKAQELVNEHAGKINRPTWVGSTVGNDASIPDSSYKGGIPGDGVPDGAASAVDGGVRATASRRGKIVLNQDSISYLGSTDVETIMRAEGDLDVTGSDPLSEFFAKKAGFNTVEEFNDASRAEGEAYDTLVSDPFAVKAMLVAEDRTTATEKRSREAAFTLITSKLDIRALRDPDEYQKYRKEIVGTAKYPTDMSISEVLNVIDEVFDLGTTQERAARKGLSVVSNQVLFQNQSFDDLVAQIELMLPDVIPTIAVEEIEDIDLAQAQEALGLIRDATGYQGDNIAEGIEYARALQKFGPEGMTFEARMARAESMGFNIKQIFYHGSQTNTIVAFIPDYEGMGRPFIFVSADPEFATDYAGLINPYADDLEEGGQPTPTVYPVLIKDVDILDHESITREDTSRLEAAMQQILSTDFDSDIPGSIGWRISAIRRGDWQTVESDEVIQEALQMAGYSGFTVSEGFESGERNDKVKNHALYSPADIRSIHAAFDPGRANEATILAQKKGASPEPRGEMEMLPNDERIIRLGKTSDESTFLHEASHLFLETEKQLARKYGLGDKQKAILKMLKVDSFDKITRNEHELFARTFEDYLRQGKAPTRDLQVAFSYFRQWLRRIYKSMRQLGLPLSKEVTEVFDRMLATDAAIAGVAAGPEYEQFFKNQEGMGFTDKQWEAHQKRASERVEKAEATLFEKLLKELRYRRSKEWNEEKQPILDEQRETLEVTPVYQAIRILKDIKIDRAMVLEALGLETMPANSKLNFMAKNGGEDPSTMVEELGFDSLSEMVIDIHNSIGLEAAADAEAEKIMIAKYGDIMNDGSIEQEARDAMHNEVQAQLMLDELKAIKAKLRNKSTPDVDIEFLKAKAAEAVSGMTYSELKPNRFYRAEVRAAKNTVRAKTMEEAYEAKLQQLANHYLYKAALKAQSDAGKFRKLIKDMQKRVYKASTVDPEFAQSIRRLARLYDTSNRPNQPARVARARQFGDWLAGQQRDGVDVSLKDLNIAGLQAGTEILPSFDEMTLEELQSVHDQLKHLRFVGGKIATESKSELVVEREGLLAQLGLKKSKKEQGLEDMNAKLEQMGPTPTPQRVALEEKIKAMEAKINPWLSTKTKQGRAGRQHMIMLVPSLRNMIRDLGDGAFFDSIYRRISDAENTKLAKTEEYYKVLDDMFAGKDLRKLADSKTSGQTVIKEDGSKWVLSARQRFMLTVYWGTETSREAIRQGYNVTDKDVESMMSFLSEEELDMVQGIWGHSDHMMPDIFNAAHDREGVAPAKLQNMPFTVNGKAMSGGHMRLFYSGSAADTKLRLDSDPLSAVNSVVNSKVGSVIERKGSGGRVPLLEVQNIYRTVEENAHFVAYAKTAVELQHIFNHKDVRAMIADKMGEGYDKALLQSIQGLTTNYKESDSSTTLAAIMRQLRYAKSMMYLAYNVKNVLQQLASVVPSMAEMGPINYLSAATSFHGNFKENRDFVERKSAQMRGRKVHLNRESADMLKRVETGSKYEEISNKFAQHGFTPHVMLDMIVSYPTWMATYQEGMLNHGDEQKAIIDADVRVAETIGSGMDLHLGKIFRSNEADYMKMLVVFGSWFNSSVFQRAYRNTKGGTGIVSVPAFEALVLTPLLTMMISEVIAMNIPQWGDDEDGGEFMLKLAKWAGLGYTGFMGATIPIFGDLLPSQNSFKPSTLIDDAVGTAMELPGFAGRAIEGEVTPIEGLNNFLKVAGTYYAVPGLGNVTRPLDYLDSALQGNEKAPENVGEVIGTVLQPFVEGAQRNK